MVSTRDRSLRTSLGSESRKHSVVVGEEILRNIGVAKGMDLVSYPKSGTWRIDTLTFHESKMTSLILKRPETSIFPIFARFSDDHLSGEIICELSDGKPAITVDNEILKFKFDPFAMYIASLNEGFRSSRIGALKQTALMIYWQMPPIIRKGVSQFSRRYETSHVRCLKDLGILGICNNVIVHLIEQHMLETGLLGKQTRPSFAVITHDIDTDYCQREGREMVSSVADDERVQATWFFVPRSVHYTLDRKGVRSLIENGHEIGMHGYSHDGSLALNNAGKLSAKTPSRRQFLPRQKAGKGGGDGH
ncbi:MAG: polysaccharide deacetylase family protein, partial [Candidatus Sifarchaeia archaeon]